MKHLNTILILTLLAVSLAISLFGFVILNKGKLNITDSMPLLYCGTSNFTDHAKEYDYSFASPNEMRTVQNEVSNGKSVFEDNCLSCHVSLGRKGDLVFHDLFERLPDGESYFKAYIQNSKKLKDSGDLYAQALDKENDADYEHSFNKMSDEEIKTLITFIKATDQ